MITNPHVEYSYLESKFVAIKSGTSTGSPSPIPCTTIGEAEAKAAELNRM